MTTTPISSAASDVDSGAGWETARTDLTLGGRAKSSAEFLEGLVAEGMLDTVGRPEKLPNLLFPGVDPAVVYDIWSVAFATGLRAGRVSVNPGFRRDELERHRAALAGAGYHAMAGQVARSLATISTSAEEHPADGESDREH
jgi:hypothetical protein